MAQIKIKQIILDRHEISISATDFSSVEMDFLGMIGPASEIDGCEKLTWSASAFPGHPPPRAAIPGQENNSLATYHLQYKCIITYP